MVCVSTFSLKGAGLEDGIEGGGGGGAIENNEIGIK